MALTDIPHVVDLQLETELRPDGTMENIVVVFTDLELDVLHRQHDKAEVDKLLNALAQHIQGNPHHVGKLRVTTRRR